jgi:CheY-like chemotaxis protein
MSRSSNALPWHDRCRSPTVSSLHLRPGSAGARSQLAAGSFLLVADDDEAEVCVVCAVLENAGYTVGFVRDGRELLDAMNQGPLPSLVLLDLMMPRSDGWRALALMSANARLAEVPVLIVTGLDTVEDLPPGRPVLHKPVDADVLVDMVSRLLRRRR